MVQGQYLSVCMRQELPKTTDTWTPNFSLIYKLKLIKVIHLLSYLGRNTFFISNTKHYADLATVLCQTATRNLQMWERNQQLSASSTQSTSILQGSFPSGAEWQFPQTCHSYDPIANAEDLIEFSMQSLFSLKTRSFKGIMLNITQGF